MARIGTHLFHFAAYMQGLRGLGPRRATCHRGPGTRGCRRTSWPTRRSSTRAATAGATATCCAWRTRSRSDETQNAVFHWITQGWPDVGDAPHPDEALRPIWAFERAKRARSAAEVAGLIRAYRLPREAIPTEWLNDREVWAALLEDMPLTAMIRNLATMTRAGLLAPMSEAAGKIAAALTDGERLRTARVHPVAVLSALTTYQSGRGVRGQGQWKPVARWWMR